MASGKWKGRLWECDRLASCLAPLAQTSYPTPAAMADIEKEAVYEVISSTTAEEATKVSVADAAEHIPTGSLVTAPWLSAVSAGDSSSHEGHATSVALPGWTQQLKGQTVVENAIEGRAGNAEKMEMQHHRLMQKLEQQAQQDAKAQQTSAIQYDVDDASVHGPGREQLAAHDRCRQG